MPKLKRGSIRKVIGKFGKQEYEFFSKESKIDIIKVYQQLKCVAEIPVDKLMDRYTLMKAINSATRDSMLANKIWLIAKREKELYQIEYLKKLGVLTKKATEKIQLWMDLEGIKKKQITKDLIEQELCSGVLEDDYRELIERREDIKLIANDCERLATEWSDRKWTLRTQAQLLSAEKEFVLKGKRN